MKRFVHIVLLMAALLVACGPMVTPTSIPISLLPAETPLPSMATTDSRTLTVFAAASLTDAFTEIGHNFESAHPGVTIALNFAGSQTLSTQLTEGAVADIFASANHAEMDKLITNGLVRQDAPVDFLTNRLIVILPSNNPGNVDTLHDLSRPGLKLIMAADTVPAGKYALQVLDKMSNDTSFGLDFKARVLSNVVSYENDIKLVAAKVQLGEADAGIVYISDSIAAPELETIEIPLNINVIARYPITALINAAQPELASEFIDYLLSADGQAILKQWGFTPVNP